MEDGERRERETSLSCWILCSPLPPKCLQQLGLDKAKAGRFEPDLGGPHLGGRVLTIELLSAASHSTHHQEARCGRRAGTGGLRTSQMTSSLLCQMTHRADFSKYKNINIFNYKTFSCQIEKPRLTPHDSWSAFFNILQATDKKIYI